MPLCARLQNSKFLVAVIIFFAWIFDKMILTSLAPFLPALLSDLEGSNSSLQNHLSSIGFALNGTNVTAGPTTFQHQAQHVGIILASQPATEVVFAIVCASLVHRFGYRAPLILGSTLNLAGTLILAYSPSFLVILLGQFVRSAGSSLSITTGMSLLVQLYSEDNKRIAISSLILIGETLGTLIGNGLSATVYQFLGQKGLFLGLSTVCLGDLVLRFIPTYKCKVIPSELNNNSCCKTEKRNQEPNIWKFVKDPYILLLIGINITIRVDVGSDGAILPAWLLDKFSVSCWKIGVLLAIPAMFQMSERVILSAISLRCRVRYWTCCLLGAMLTATGLLIYPFCRVFWIILLPQSLVRIGSALTTSTVSPMLAYIVDLRHGSSASNYTSVYSLFVVSYNFGMMSGQILGGNILRAVGFKWLCWSFSILSTFMGLLSLFYLRMDYRKGYINLPNDS